ncbi:MAG: hypothetical protein EA401_13545 [Planctomycetota bacterium]|nr:MAG: hypothetical protein EA401_13545 [Planctomycetota bacterium]
MVHGSSLAIMDTNDSPYDPEIDAHVEESWQEFLFDRCADGERLARAALRLAPFRGDCWYVLAVNLERQRRLSAADRAFQRAALAPINPQPAPFRVSWNHCERALERAADILPQFLSRAMEEVTLVLRNYAAPEVLPPGTEAEPLFFHLGPTRDQADAHGISDTLPDAAIHIYRRSHEHLSRNAREFDRGIAHSLIRGLGTFLGYNDQRVDALLQELA